MSGAADVARALADQAEGIATALLGEPSSRTRRELRWGNHGSFSLALAGGKRGWWYDHEAGEGGDMLHLVAREHGVRLGDAIRIAERDYLGGTTPAPAPRRAGVAVPDINQMSAKAMRLWQRTSPADWEHPYLVRKRVRPHGIGQLGHCLVIPVQWPAMLTGLQYISPDGAKRFMSGTVKKGAYHILGDPALRPTGALAFAEGYATAATVYEAVGVPTVVAFDAGNLLPAAERLRRIFTAAEFVFAADLDEAGARGSRAAALATGGKIISMGAA